MARDAHPVLTPPTRPHGFTALPHRAFHLVAALTPPPGDCPAGLFYGISTSRKTLIEQLGCYLVAAGLVLQRRATRATRAWATQLAFADKDRVAVIVIVGAGAAAPGRVVVKDLMLSTQAAVDWCDVAGAVRGTLDGRAGQIGSPDLPAPRAGADRFPIEGSGDAVAVFRSGGS